MLGASAMQFSRKRLEQLNVPGFARPLQVQPSIISPTSLYDRHALKRR
jgi:hypothetical protein